MIVENRPPIDLLRAAFELGEDLRQRFRKSEGISSLQAAVEVVPVGAEFTYRILITYKRPSVHRTPHWIDRVPRSVPVGAHVIPVSVLPRAA